jgi:hypothetical protein
MWRLLSPELQMELTMLLSLSPFFGCTRFEKETLIEHFLSHLNLLAAGLQMTAYPFQIASTSGKLTGRHRRHREHGHS